MLQEEVIITALTIFINIESLLITNTLIVIRGYAFLPVIRIISELTNAPHAHCWIC